MAGVCVLPAVVSAADGDEPDISSHTLHCDDGAERLPTSQMLWAELSAQMTGFLADLTLADFAGKPKVSTELLRHDSMAGRIHAMFPTRAAMSAQFT